MPLSTILIIILIVLLLGAFPAWGYNRSWGYGPSGLIGLLLVVILILFLLGKI
jgi:hypothetical protein